MQYRLQRTAFVVLVLGVLLSKSAFAVDTSDTRMLHNPAISENHIAFSYAGDLWIADRDGSNPRRLTSDIGDEVLARFSPDGQTIAFTAEYDGNFDIFLVDVGGGAPKRLTWHPGPDLVRDFAPDGKSILFVSPRTTHTTRFMQLYSVSIDGGMPRKLPIPSAWKASYSPDGSRIAYTPLREAFAQWKHYRGGRISRIWVYDVATQDVVEVPKPEEGCNDTDPMWVGDKVYFTSDRAGEFNIFSFDPAQNQVTQQTFEADFPMREASTDGETIVYEKAGYLHTFNTSDPATKRLQIGVSADLVETRPRYMSGNEYIRAAGISPSGSRAIFEFRGEIVSVPKKKGDPRVLTHTPGIHERSPRWSPNGRQVAYFSDASGEYELHVVSQKGTDEVKTFPMDGAGYYDSPRWSPDGSKISFLDNSQSLFWIDLGTGKVNKVASEPLYGPVRSITHSWSPDSAWLTYTLSSMAGIRQVYVHELSTGKSNPVTDGLTDVGDPVFDASGDYLYFTASTNAGPVRQWFAMSNSDFLATNVIYMAVLRRGQVSPLAKESDEEEPGGKEAEAEEGSDDGTAIDFEGLSERIVALPVEPASYSGLRAGEAGKLYYMKSKGGTSLFDSPEGSLTFFDLKSREETSVLDGVSFFEINAGGTQVLALSNGSWVIGDAGGEIDRGKCTIPTSSIEVLADPKAEWAQMLREAWRLNRDYFYDPGMHGVDWPAMWEKYKVFLPHLTTRTDFTGILQAMCGELVVGHSYTFGGDDPSQARRVPGGLLGADFEVHQGRYRIAKIYGGLNWNPDLRSPLTEPGVDAVAGEYLLTVNGEDLQAPENLYRFFENTSGKIVELTLASSPSGSNSRTVQVVPVASELALRNRDWVEGNLKRVTEATHGRVAYVWVPNTTQQGHEYFKRYFFPQSDRDAIIVDERHNGGGQIADYVINILQRPHIGYWNFRYGNDLRTPQGSIQGPKVMLIDETAGSGGDLLPWMFRKFDMGTIIGRRTWGGLVGILGYPPLMDGGTVTAPNIAFFTKNGWEVENVGVAPDIEVVQWPKDQVDGRDPQLEKAIKVVMEQLESHPPQEVPRPPYPNKTKP